MADAPPSAKVAGGNDGDTSSDAKLVQFMDFTGAAEDVAKYWLEVSESCRWKLLKLALRE